MNLLNNHEKKTETALGLVESLFHGIPLAGVEMENGTAFIPEPQKDRQLVQEYFDISGSSLIPHQENQGFYEVGFKISSTEDTVDIFELNEYIENLFAAATSEVFEDGMDSVFASNIEIVIKEYGNLALFSIARIILGEISSVDVIAEELVKLGSMTHQASYKNRLRLLEKSLRSKSRYIRDAAAIGIALMDDPDALPYVISAIEQELVDELRKDLQLVVSQLEKTHRCQSLSE